MKPVHGSTSHLRRRWPPPSSAMSTASMLLSVKCCHTTATHSLRPLRASNEAGGGGGGGGGPIACYRRNLAAWQRRRKEGGPPPPPPASGRGGTASTFPAQRSSPSPAFVLDPPYTPVEGEREAALALSQAAEDTAGCRPLQLLYSCRGCGSLLFSAADAAASGGATKVGHFGGCGWPTFVASLQPLTLRSSSQRTVAGAASTAAGQSAGRGPLAGVLPPQKSMSYRGLPVEGDLHVVKGGGGGGGGERRGGGGIAARRPQSWREACLRDANKRADPHYIEGCCRRCGSAVCRVVVRHRELAETEEAEAASPTAPGGGPRRRQRKSRKSFAEVVYVTTASAVRAEVHESPPTSSPRVS